MLDRQKVALLVPLVTFACAASAPSADLEKRIVAVAEAVTPSVVHIQAILKLDDRRNEVTGSGLIVTADGAILTNEHVVDDAEKITVSVPGRKRKYPARLVGTDRQTDVALLRIDPDPGHPFTAAKLSPEPVHVGQWVLAIGNPYGLDGTVSLGIVSAKGRNLEIPDLLNDFIQTDALIDRGSSGGPLVDLDGRVVGINSRGQGRGIGFTIPIETARDVMKQLDNGGIERGYLGISLQPLDRDLAEHLGLGEATGVLISQVVPKSPADRAGLVTGDVITRFEGREVEAEEEEDLGSFQRLVASAAPGTRVELDYLRGGKPGTAKIEIGEQPKIEGEEVETSVGFHVKEITPNLARVHRLTSTVGAFVTFVASGSPASEAGLRMGDVIVRVEGADVASLAGFRTAIAGIDMKHRFLVQARRGDELRFLLIKPRAAGPGTPPDDTPDAAAQVSPPPVR
ncbi:MAG: PDZ domain-containing protein [Deltaproteobacteria bacterium]|nr:MAG: PDZ domain-containing protein [Deltaproteobacteria bacterium]